MSNKSAGSCLEKRGVGAPPPDEPVYGKAYDNYQMGLGVEENLDEAAVWYTRSSCQGYGLASNNLAGIHHQRGHIDTAKHFYQLAQKQGFQHSPAA